MAKIVGSKLIVEFKLGEDFNAENNANLQTLISLMFSDKHLGNSNFVTFLGKPKMKVVKEIVYEKEEDVKL